jgi:hypothetical protein
MRPDDRRWIQVSSDEEPFETPLDAALEDLAAELAASGGRARNGLYGRTQPTNAFAAALRGRLLARLTEDHDLARRLRG